LLNAKENLEHHEDVEPPPSEGPAAILEQLDRLHQQGILTDAEFQEKKADLLARL
jgi:hypothetical protein